VTLSVRKRPTGWASTRREMRLPPPLRRLVASKEVTEHKAMEMARGYLHDNALSLYPPARQ
jgi:hypothetical protein